MWDHMEGGASSPVSSASACQERCASTANCVHFSFWADGGCTLADISSTPHPTTHAQGVISGPATCPAGSCDAVPMPENGFPAATASASMSAWQAGRQPMVNECWPKAEDGTYFVCENPVVLQDTADGWPGRCMGMHPNRLEDGEDCAELCISNPFCPSWQNNSDGDCFHGMGYHCLTRDGAASFDPAAAQRIQHGEVRTIMQMTNYEIAGLHFVFASGYYINQTDAVEACKFTCYSNILCQYWQYLDSGCYVEDPPQYKVPYPLTTANAHNSPEAIARVYAGEYIQHYCPQPKAATAPPPATTTTTTTTLAPFLPTSPPLALVDSPTNTTCNLFGLENYMEAYLDCWHQKAVLVIASLIVAALLCLCCLGLCKPTPKQPRAIKPKRQALPDPEPADAAAEDGESAPLIPQAAPAPSPALGALPPNFLFSQPLMTPMTAPLTTMSQPQMQPMLAPSFAPRGMAPPGMAPPGAAPSFQGASARAF